MRNKNSFPCHITALKTLFLCERSRHYAKQQRLMMSPIKFHVSWAIKLLSVNSALKLTVRRYRGLDGSLFIHKAFSQNKCQPLLQQSQQWKSNVTTEGLPSHIEYAVLMGIKLLVSKCFVSGFVSLSIPTEFRYYRHLQDRLSEGNDKLTGVVLPNEETVFQIIYHSIKGIGELGACCLCRLLFSWTSFMAIRIWR